MKQTSNRKQSVSYIYYFFLGAYIAVEPFFLKLFFKTYLPDLNYPFLTIPISVVLCWIGYQKLFATFGDLTIKQILVAIAQELASLLSPKFRKKALSRCQICFRVLTDLPQSLYSQEEMVHVHSKKAFKYFSLIGIFVSLLFGCVCYLFLVNLPQWGLLETSLTTLFYLFCIGITSIALTGLPKVIQAAKLLRNARKSELDLNALLKMLRKGLEGWQFRKRIVFPSDNIKQNRDIDVVATSPDGNYFVIELKSHIGKVTWNSEFKQLWQQRTKASRPLPLEDFFDDLNKQAKLLHKSWNLSKSPDRVLIFWRAKVDIGSKKRLQRGVKISEKSQIVKDLEKRNRKLVEKKQNTLLLKRNN